MEKNFFTKKQDLLILFWSEEAYFYLEIQGLDFKVWNIWIIF